MGEKAKILLLPTLICIYGLQLANINDKQIEFKFKAREIVKIHIIM